MPKSNSIITTKVDTVGRAVTFSIAGAGPAGPDGNKTAVVLTVDLSKVHPANVDYAAFHGFKQRIQDAAAIGFIKEEKRYATPEEKVARMFSLVEHLNSGSAEWSPTRSERIGSDESLLSRVMTELYPTATAEEIRAKVTGWTKPIRAAMLARPEFAKVADRIRAEASAGVDTDSLLADLAE